MPGLYVWLVVGEGLWYSRASQVGDEIPASGDVPPHAAEGLGEGAHQDVHVSGVHARVLA